jgi:hypothetical protein
MTIRTKMSEYYNGHHIDDSRALDWCTILDVHDLDSVCISCTRRVLLVLPLEEGKFLVDSVVIKALQIGNNIELSGCQPTTYGRINIDIGGRRGDVGYSCPGTLWE